MEGRWEEEVETKPELLESEDECLLTRSAPWPLPGWTPAWDSSSLGECAQTRLANQSLKLGFRDWGGNSP